VDYGMAFDRVGKAHVRAQAALRSRLVLDATAALSALVRAVHVWASSIGRLQRGGAQGDVAAADALRVWGTGAYRKYQESDAPIILGGVERESKRGELGAEWLVNNRLSFEGQYRWERGAGAFLSSGEATVRWSPLERLSVFVDGTAFQQIEEYRVGEGFVTGFGGGAEVELLARTRLLAGANMYRQEFENRSSGPTEPAGHSSTNIGLVKTRARPGSPRVSERRGRSRWCRTTSRRSCPLRRPGAFSGSARCWPCWCTGVASGAGLGTGRQQERPHRTHAGLSRLHRATGSRDR
jgi:hypothetical protein